MSVSVGSRLDHAIRSSHDAVLGLYTLLLNGATTTSISTTRSLDLIARGLQQSSGVVMQTVLT